MSRNSTERIEGDGPYVVACSSNTHFLVARVVAVTSPHPCANEGQGMENVIAVRGWKERKGDHYLHRKRREVEMLAEAHLSPPPLVAFAVAAPAAHDSRRME